MRAGCGGGRRRVALLGLLTALTLLCAACATTVGGVPTVAPGSIQGMDPGFVHGSDGGTVDRLAAAAVTDVQAYWRQTYPAVFGHPWQDISGGFYSVDPDDPRAVAPPCADKATEVMGNAFYCSTADAVAWDRAALLPVLRARFGDAAVVLVLAHEMGHAVQRRSGLTVQRQRADPQRYPTMLVETMADCYAGTFVRWVADGRAPHLRIGATELDSALNALTTFRDPVGTSESDAQAHGDAFDRVAAFQDGYQHGAALCAGMTVDNRHFTLHSSATMGSGDAMPVSNLPLDAFLGAVTPDLDTYFRGVVEQRGGHWPRPAVQRTGTEPTCSGGDQGPVAYCPSGRADQGGRIDIDVADVLPDLRRRIGDYAVGTMVASRFGLAALAALGRPVDRPEAGSAALCLAGAYTGALRTRHDTIALGPGDMDKAVRMLLGDDFGSRDVTGHGMSTGFDRLAVFRTGVENGPAACGIG